MRSEVSVIIPCFRCAATIGRAMSSVIAQTLAPEEIILVEDFSDDGGITLGVLNTLRQLYSTIDIQIISLPRNLGPGGARNAGWLKARFKFLAFLDSDDSWHPQKLELQIAWMQAHPEVTLTGTISVYRMDQEPISKVSALAPIVRNVSGSQLLLKNTILTRTVVLKRDVSERFDPVKRYAEDYLLWLQIVLGGRSASIICLPLAYSYRLDFASGGLTSNLWRMQKGVMHTYWTIASQGHISKFTSLLFIFLSLLKFVRRLIISASLLIRRLVV